ncbi:MAG TPA: RecX family transcriptional regulator [Patescibacteria group bacterium]|nr:RecX family transcriptional regulator [Patescibacteria group bacterium]
MPIITSIKSQKSKKRVNIYLDDEQSSPLRGKFGFGIDLDNFIKLGLRVGQELTQERLEEIVKKAEFQKFLDKLLMFATLRPRSEKEVRDYFRRKEVHVSMHEELTEKLRHFELLDDLKFAKWWIDQRMQFKPKSKRIIIQELRIKGISQNNIDDAFGETVIDEEKLARELIEKKSYKWKNLESRSARQKMSQYLAGKGFNWDIIKKVV